MTAERFAWRPVFGADAAWAAFWIFAVPWGMSAWFLFLCEWLGFPLPDGTNKWMVVPLLLIFLPLQISVVRNVLDKRDRLVVDAEGLLWRPWSERVIPWSAIQRVTHTTAVGQDYVGLWLKDPDQHGATGLTRLLSWHSKHGDVPIHMKPSGATVPQLFAAIARFRSDLVPSGS